MEKENSDLLQPCYFKNLYVHKKVHQNLNGPPSNLKDPLQLVGDQILFSSKLVQSSPIKYEK